MQSELRFQDRARDRVRILPVGDGGVREHGRHADIDGNRNSHCSANGHGDRHCYGDDACDGDLHGHPHCHAGSQPYANSLDASNGPDALERQARLKAGFCG